LIAGQYIFADVQEDRHEIRNPNINANILLVQLLNCPSKVTLGPGVLLSKLQVLNHTEVPALRKKIEPIRKCNGKGSFFLGNEKCCSAQIGKGCFKTILAT
tara:strand:- start:106 stop:408 length:303 start_codon:yes stop_codon:yes gene_type:complete